jgi:hypothetical protein
MRSARKVMVEVGTLLRAAWTAAMIPTGMIHIQRLRTAALVAALSGVLRIVLFEACSMFTHVAACTLAVTNS